jgi:ADP-ribosyl-[dinitrogen reductase] hydrolase
MTPILQERIVGALVGLALGDALGAPVEWLDRQEIASRYPAGVRDFIARGGTLGQVTDDTDMAFVTSESMVACGGLNMDDLAIRLPKWAQSRTDLGGTTLTGIAALGAGIHWSISGADKAPSSGCLPRCAPVALAVPLLDVATATADCCRATHRHPLAIAASIAQNLLTARLVRGETWANAAFALERCPLATEYDDAWAAVVQSFSDGSPAADGSPAVLAEAFRSVDQASDAEAALVASVSMGGDTDTRGAIAGLLAGARWGFGALPTRWLENCPATSAACRLGLALASVMSQHSGERVQLLGKGKQSIGQ